MKVFIASLLSRKFLLALGTFLVLVANNQYTEAVAVVIGYLGAEGAADVAQRYGEASSTVVVE